MTIRQQAYHESVRTPVTEVAAHLQETLGQKLVGYAIDVADPRLIGKYARGEVRPSNVAATRLRELYLITRVLLSKENPETVRAWMLGAHPLLEDHAPIELLHDANSGPVTRAVTTEAARRSFQRVADVAEAFVTT